MTSSPITEIISRTSTDNLSSVVAALNAIKKQQPAFKHSVKVFVLRNYTIEGIDPYLQFHLYKNEINVEVKYGDYGVVSQYLLDPDSALYDFKPDIILLSLHLENFAAENNLPGWDGTDTQERMISLLELLKQKTSALVVLNNFLLPFYSTTGITNSAALPNRAETISHVNLALNKFSRENASRFFVVDWNMIMMRLGSERSIDERYWYLSKAPFKKEFLNAFATEFSKIITALKGLNKKCLILDCDNTLWGGIIGEDGLEGIKLDNDSYPGKVYYDFQKSVINLYNRGVIIALCSKNNPEDVFEVLEKHPHSLIKKEHLATTRINWNNKAANIDELVKDLNIGFDSVVFVDDSDMECDLVKKALPDVTVMQVPVKDLFAYTNMLMKDGLFDTLTFSDEDRSRTKMYQSETLRKESLSSFDNLDEYLHSLGIVVDINEVQSSSAPRVAQLTQKTNQFNLTTRRYSEADIHQFIADDDKLIYSLNIKDKYGDMGLTAVLILARQNDIGIVDSLLLSCRILGRNIEIAFVQYCLAAATQKWNIKTWEAEYIATKKNVQTANFMEKFGFHVTDENPAGKSYRCLANELVVKDLTYIQINNG